LTIILPGPAEPGISARLRFGLLKD